MNSQFDTNSGFDSNVYSKFSNTQFNTIRSFKNAVRALVATFTEAKIASEDTDSFTIYHDWDTITIEYNRATQTSTVDYSLDN